MSDRLKACWTNTRRVGLSETTRFRSRRFTNGFPAILIVADFIHRPKTMPFWSVQGGFAGSIVVCLKITDLDPMGELFERFLNPERVSMPDFVDFCMDGGSGLIMRRTVRSKPVVRLSPC